MGGKPLGPQSNCIGRNGNKTKPNKITRTDSHTHTDARGIKSRNCESETSARFSEGRENTGKTHARRRETIPIAENSLPEHTETERLLLVVCCVLFCFFALGDRNHIPKARFSITGLCVIREGGAVGAVGGRAKCRHHRGSVGAVVVYRVSPRAPRSF